MPEAHPQARLNGAKSVMDCGGKRSATPLSCAQDGLVVPPSSPVRKRRRRIRSAGVLQDTPVASAHPTGFQSSTPLASKCNARNFHRRDLLSGRGVKSAGGPPGQGAFKAATQWRQASWTAVASAARHRLRKHETGWCFHYRRPPESAVAAFALPAHSMTRPFHLRIQGDSSHPLRYLKR